MNFEMNIDSSSSSSSEDEIYDYMLMDFVEESREIQAVEDAVRYIVSSTVEGSGTEGSRPRKKRAYISRDRESANEIWKITLPTKFRPKFSRKMVGKFSD